MKYIILILLLALTIFGCEKEVALRYESDATEKIVLNGIISPQEGIQISISKSSPATDVMVLDDVYLNAATAILYKDTVVVDTLINIDDYGRFRLPDQDVVEENVLYTLWVHADGLPSVHTDLLIPASFGQLTGTYKSVSGTEGEISIDFDVVSSQMFYAQILGFDSLGIARQVWVRSGSNQKDCETYYYPRTFVHSDCFRPNSPRIILKLDTETIQYEPHARVNLHKIEFSISLVDAKYEGIFDINDLDHLGYAEPVFIKSHVEGGYGFVLPINTKTIEFNF